MIFENNSGCIIIAEVAQSHDGSLGMAHSFIDAIADTGANAVKFQTHIAAAESTPDEPWRVKFSQQDESRYQYWKRMEFSEEQWRGLRKHAEKRGLLFLSSPFSIEAVDMLVRVGVAAWKIPSGELSNIPMLERIIETELPILLSTGMSSINEIDRTVKTIQSKNLPLIVLQCTSMYPVPPEKVGLNLISFIRDRYQCSVGLSDHSGTIYPTLAAATLGIDVIEVHVTFSKQMFGPDVAASVTFEELGQLVEGVRFIEKMIRHPMDKDKLIPEMIPMRQLFTKSIVVRTDLPAGTVLQDEHLAFKKPGVGISVARVQELVGRRLHRPVQKDQLLKEQDIEGF